MSDIFDEASSEIRNEQIIALLKKYGYYIIIAIVAIISSAAFFVLWKNKQTTEQENLGKIYYNMQQIDKNGNDEAIVMESLDHLIKNRSSSYSALASLKKADLLVNSTNYLEAIHIYDDIASNSKTEKALRDLSAISAANIIISQNIANMDIENRLEKLLTIDEEFLDSAILLKALYLKNNNKIQELSNMVSSLNNISKETKEKLTILEGSYDTK